MPDVGQSTRRDLADRIEAALRPGVEWLTWEQKPEAVVTQFGTGTKMGQRWSFYVAPHGPAFDVRGSVVAFKIKKRYADHSATDLLNPITPREWERLEVAVARLSPVLSKWNGAGFGTGSFQIAAEACESLAHAFANYHGGGGSGARRVATPKGWW